MKPPKCRLCSTHHWSHQPHVSAKDAGEPSGFNPEATGVTHKPAPVVTQPVVTGSVVTQSPSSVVTRGKSTSTERGRRWLAANRDKRNAYMRDYRAKRAAEKASDPASRTLVKRSEPAPSWRAA